MCHKVTCPQCHKATWEGCGEHIEAALAGVPAEQRCICPRPTGARRPVR